MTEIIISKKSYDVVVVGAGLAGIRAAITCANEKKEVLLITASVLCSGSSFYPLMDTLHCLVTAGEQDKESFYQDIHECSHSMHDEWMNRYYIDHIGEAIRRMPEMGIFCHKLPEKKIACFGHTYRDLYYWKDWNGIRKNVRRLTSGYSNLFIMEHTPLFQLLTENRQITGVVVARSGRLHAISAKAVILAGGGLGGLYQHNINSSDITGSTHFLAAKAGAALINLEFNQFIPGFLSHPYKTVFREGTLRYCTGLIDSDGRDVLKNHQHCLDIRETHGPFTSSYDSKYFDFALTAAKGGCTIRYSPDIANDSRPYVQDYMNWLRTEHQIDITTDNIVIAPFYHAANGGIAVNHQCETQVAGLFACGEAAGGIHGANRLGGMATGSCLVFGHLAALSACRHVVNISQPLLSCAQIREEIKSTYTCCDVWANHHVCASPLLPDSIIDEIRRLMWMHGNISRKEDDLLSSIREIDSMAIALNRNDYPHTDDFFRAIQFVDLSRAMLIAMLNRRESRGSHYREDYPALDTGFSSRRIMVEMAEKLCCSTTHRTAATHSITN